VEKYSEAKRSEAKRSERQLNPRFCYEANSMDNWTCKCGKPHVRTFGKAPAFENIYYYIVFGEPDESGELACRRYAEFLCGKGQHVLIQNRNYAKMERAANVECCSGTLFILIPFDSDAAAECLADPNPAAEGAAAFYLPAGVEITAFRSTAPSGKLDAKAATAVDIVNGYPRLGEKRDIKVRFTRFVCDR
jgi:hypothetical protein